MGLKLTGELQLEAFAGVGSVGDELQPHGAGGAVDAGAQQLRVAEGAQQPGRAVGAIVDLGGTRNPAWKSHPCATPGIKPSLPRAAVAAPGSLAVPTARLDRAWSTLGQGKVSLP